MRRKGRRIRKWNRQWRWRKKGTRRRRWGGGEEKMASWKNFNDWFLIKAVDRLGKIHAVVHSLGQSSQTPQSAEDMFSTPQ